MTPSAAIRLAIIALEAARKPYEADASRAIHAERNTGATVNDKRALEQYAKYSEAIRFQQGLEAREKQGRMELP